MRRPKNALNFSGLFEQFLAWKPGPKRTSDVPRRQRRMRTAQLTHGWRRDQRPRIDREYLRRIRREDQSLERRLKRERLVAARQRTQESRPAA